VDGNWTISRVLRQECDDLIEIGASHLRPYANLLTGMSGIGVDSSSSPLSNGRSGSSTGTLSPLSHGTHASPPPSSHLTAEPVSPANGTPLLPYSTGSQSSALHSSGPQIPPVGPYTGPQQLAPAPVPVQQSAPSLADAVKSAHQEGQDFGESVARDAPALWLEAVLARKPRMPSDLEARLLQGSSLPIDFLLHDEVRHALRRGFWDALERSRR
jgi:hypothetical protein